MGGNALLMRELGLVVQTGLSRQSATVVRVFSHRLGFYKDSGPGILLPVWCCIALTCWLLTMATSLFA